MIVEINCRAFRSSDVKLIHKWSCGGGVYELIVEFYDGKQLKIRDGANVVNDGYQAVIDAIVHDKCTESEAPNV